ncbi:hypothetical protein EON65_53770 [archaeon]|nr:MAG: hypothetical protein EON65_53770 [archaeon]
MTLRFVKTSVLSSTDGIDFSNEVAVESEEAKMARITAERHGEETEGGRRDGDGEVQIGFPES